MSNYNTSRYGGSRDTDSDASLKAKLLIYGGVAAIFILGSCAKHAAYSVPTEQNLTVTVQDKYIKRIGNVDKFFIVTDVGIFENTDDWFYGKTNSADVYSKMHVGKTYEVKVSGNRNTTMSWFPNIVSQPFEVPNKSTSMDMQWNNPFRAPVKRLASNTGIQIGSTHDGRAITATFRGEQPKLAM
jgi:hypothetical protein